MTIERSERVRMAALVRAREDKGTATQAVEGIFANATADLTSGFLRSVSRRKPVSPERVAARDEVMHKLDDLGIRDYQLSTKGSWYHVELPTPEMFRDACIGLGITSRITEKECDLPYRRIPAGTLLAMYGTCFITARTSSN